MALLFMDLMILVNIRHFIFTNLLASWYNVVARQRLQNYIFTIIFSQNATFLRNL